MENKQATVEHPDLWRITLYELDGAAAHEVFVAVKSETTRRGVMDFSRSAIHTPEWWDGYLVVELEYQGKLWAVYGIGEV